MEIIDLNTTSMAYQKIILKSRYGKNWPERKRIFGPCLSGYCQFYYLRMADQFRTLSGYFENGYHIKDLLGGAQKMERRR